MQLCPCLGAKGSSMRLGRIFCLLWFFVGLALPQLKAGHIIGGVFTYECLGDAPAAGNKRYLITLKIYRDCNFPNQGAGTFDSAPNALFRGTVSIYRDAERSEYRKVILPAPQVTKLDPRAINPCVISPPRLCVEEGVYEFLLDLPIFDGTYHLVYQRCCRNATINNVVTPQSVGTTYYIDLTAEAQTSCNSSPVFDQYPPIIICAGFPLRYLHSATDPEGDELVYEICPSFTGGSLNGQGGLAPDPDAPPPFREVPYVRPTYSAANPLRADPALRINSKTGLLTATPTTQGQYVVGICVSEYRNGVLLSKVFRDFEFAVTNCQPSVVADIAEDTIIGLRTFAKTFCGSSDVTIINESYQRENIRNVEWQFDVDGRNIVLPTWDARVSFPGPGEYKGRLFVNKGGECGDSLEVFVNIFPEIRADFDYEYDTCRAGPVAFTDLSESDAGPIRVWEWNFGDGNGSSEPDPNHLFMTAGNFPVNLRVRDRNFCEASVTKNVPYFPIPPILLSAPEPVSICQPALVLFDNLSPPINNSYKIEWDFGDGNTSTALAPSHLYNSPGFYSVGVKVTSPVGCYADSVYRNWVEVKTSPTAGFDFDPKEVDQLHPTVNFFDESFGAVRWFWDFGGLGSSIQPNPVFAFPDTGQHVIRQIVAHYSGCLDTAETIIDVRPIVTYFLPNAFTPNADATNDRFMGIGILDGMRDFEIGIWNRWGEQVFASNDPETGWNGRKYNDGQPAPNGVYVYVVKYRGPRGENYLHKGTVVLVR